MLKYLDNQREIERIKKENARLQEQVAREKRIRAAEEPLMAKIEKLGDQLHRHFAVYERIPSHVFHAQEKIKSLTLLARNRVLEVMRRLDEEFDRTHDQLNAISTDL